MQGGEGWTAEQFNGTGEKLVLLLGVSIIVYDTGSIGSNFTELLSFRSLFCAM